ncbi:MAG: MurR/RpiR family transcriptional regulator [Lautropia sp.]
MTDNHRLTHAIEELYPSLSPKLRRAARYVIGSPTDVALYPLRRIAENAEVGATTLIRLANLLGFESWDLFRANFRESLRSGSGRYYNRARDLQMRLASRNAEHSVRDASRLLGEGLRETFERVAPAELDRAADTIQRARRVFVIGLRSWFAAAFYFYYVAQTFTDKFILLENRSGMMVDELGDIGPQDVVIGMTFDPYLTETVKVLHYARDRGCALIAITDSPVSPLAIANAQVFLLPTVTTSFYQSLVPTMAFLEALLAVVVVRGGKDTVKAIREGFSRRDAFGVYWKEPD